MTDIEVVREALEAEGCSDPVCFKHSHILAALAALDSLEAELDFGSPTEYPGSTNRVLELEAELAKRDENIDLLIEGINAEIERRNAFEKSAHNEYEQRKKAEAELARYREALTELYQACQMAEAAGEMVERAPILNALAVLTGETERDPTLEEMRAAIRPLTGETP